MSVWIYSTLKNIISGETLHLLRLLLEKNEKIPITLKRDNVYCLDNETFRYLAAHKNGQNFSEKEVATYTASWESSRYF